MRTKRLDKDLGRSLVLRSQVYNWGKWGVWVITRCEAVFAKRCFAPRDSNNFNGVVEPTSVWHGTRAHERLRDMATSWVIEGGIETHDWWSSVVSWCWLYIEVCKIFQFIQVWCLWCLFKKRWRDIAAPYKHYTKSIFVRKSPVLLNFRYKTSCIWPVLEQNFKEAWIIYWTQLLGEKNSSTKYPG